MDEEYYEAVDDVRPGGGLSPVQQEAFGKAGANPIWFWANKDRKDVELSLQGQPDGSYLIRSNAQDPNSFVLSVSETQRVTHYEIKRSGPARYMLAAQAGQMFPDLPSLIDFYRLHLLDETVLTMPLPPKSALQSGVAVTHYLETVRCKFNFNARDAEDLSFRKMDLLNIIEKHEAEWWKAQHQRSLEIGVIPAPYVEFVADGPVNMAKAEADEAAEIYGAMVEGSGAPPPRPGGAAPPPRPGGAKPPSVPSRGNKPAAAAPDNGAAQRAAQQQIEQQRAARAAEEAQQAAARQAAEADRQRQAAEEEQFRIQREQAREAAKAANAYKAPERPKFIIAKASLDRQANVFDKSALTFRAGDLLHVKEQNLNGLWEGTVMEGRRRDRKGHFPFTFVEVQDSGAFDAETKKAAIAFQVTELKKQGIDLSKLVKAGVQAPPPVVAPPRPSKPAPAPAAMLVYGAGDDDLVYGGGDEPPGRPPPPSRPGAPKPGGAGTMGKRAAPPPPGGGGDDADLLYGEAEEEQAQAQEIAEEEMIYGMADDFDAAAVEAAMDDIYGQL